MSNNIPIVLSVDNKYIKGTLATIISILENKNKDTKIHFYCIYFENTLSKKNELKINKLVSKYKNIIIEFYEVKFNNVDYKDYHLLSHITVTTYLRYFIPEIIEEDYDQVIYLDTDILVNKDLSPLFNIELADNYIGAVAEFCKLERYNQYLSDLKIEDNIYINSGVLLINLKKWREENICKLLQDNTKKYKDIITCGDQDVINLTFTKKIKLLPLEYNFQLLPFFYQFPKSLLYKQEDYKIAYNNIPTIIHYNTEHKPWKKLKELRKIYGKKNLYYIILWKYYYQLSKLQLLKLKLLSFLMKRPKLSIVNTLPLETLKDKYKGKRCFIIGNAPSLKELDLSLLENEYTFAVNKGYLLKEFGLNKATFYGISDINAYEEYINSNKDTITNFAKYFFYLDTIKWKITKKNTTIFTAYEPFNDNIDKKMSEGFFQVNPKEPLAGVYTIVLYMLQIAVMMGFKEIYFIGVDIKYNKEDNHFYKSDEGEKSRIDFSISKQEDVLKAFKYAHKFLSSKGIKIYNAGGKLEAIPKVPYSSLFNKK